MLTNLGYIDGKWQTIYTIHTDPMGTGPFLYQYFTGNQSEAFKISWFCGCRNDFFLYGFRLGRSNLLQRWDGKGKFGASEQGPTGYLVDESCVRGNKFASGESYKKLRNITTLEGKSTVNGLFEVAIC